LLPGFTRYYYLPIFLWPIYFISSFLNLKNL